MTTESYGMAMGHGNVADPAEEGGSVHGYTRVHASVADSATTGAITERAQRWLETVRRDVAESWLVQGHPPALGALVEQRHAIDVPADHGLLRVGRLAFNYFRVAWSAFWYGVAWAGQEPARLLAVVAVAGIVAGLITTVISLI